MEARKQGRPGEMSILQVILGEACRGSGDDGEDVDKIIRKMIASNNETIGLSTNREDMVAKLKEENTYLESLLPQVLSVEEIKNSLSEVLVDLKTAKSDGQATGMAMKHLKSRNLKVLGEDVAVAVKQVRA